MDVPQRDLIVLVADADAGAAMPALLGRTRSLGIRPISFQVDRYVRRDSGCYRDAHEYLRPFIRQFAYALVTFDRHGSGREQLSRQELEDRVETRLRQNGWANRCAAVVFDPEIEEWVWSDSPHVDVTLGWQADLPGLRPWLMTRGFLEQGATKPNRPKEAMETALRQVGKSRSSSIYRELAERVSVRRCTDPAFRKFLATLQEWFPA